MEEGSDTSPPPLREPFTALPATLVELLQPASANQDVTSTSLTVKVEQDLEESHQHPPPLVLNSRATPIEMDLTQDNKRGKLYRIIFASMAGSLTAAKATTLLTAKEIL